MRWRSVVVEQLLSILHAKVMDLPLMVQKIQLSKISGLVVWLFTCFWYISRWLRARFLPWRRIKLLQLHIKPLKHRTPRWKMGRRRFVGRPLTFEHSSTWSHDALHLAFWDGKLPWKNLFFWQLGIWIVTGWSMKLALNLGSSVGHGYDTSSTKQIHRESMHAMHKILLANETFFILMC